MEQRPLKVKVWDISIRLFHVLLIILFCLSAYSAFQSKFGIYADMHLYSGVSILILVVWRILWGLVGSETARLSHLFSSPKRLMAYVRGEGESRYGHNPLGGYSVVIVLLLLAAQVVLGLFSSDAMLFSGPFARSAGSASGTITDIHETVGYVLFGWCGLHILSVLFYAIVRKQNLVTPMVTGKTHTSKPQPFSDNDAQAAHQSTAPKLRSPLVSLLCLALAGAGIWYWVFGF